MQQPQLSEHFRIVSNTNNNVDMTIIITIVKENIKLNL